MPRYVRLRLVAPAGNDFHQGVLAKLRRYAWLVALVGLVYNLTVNADSPIFSTGVTELSPSSTLGRNMAIQSFIGFGAATLTPALFGKILDLGGDQRGWGLAFSFLGLGALVGPVALMLLRGFRESLMMAGGKR